MSFYKKLITVFAISLSCISMAKASAFPRGCESSGFVFKNGYLVLNEAGKQSFYMLHNRSKQQIEMEHYEPDPDAFMSPKLESKLLSSRWSAFASDVQNMVFQCFAMHGEVLNAVDCANFLEVCQYPRVKFALSNQGNYWVSTNKDQKQVISEATKKGIFLRW